MTEINQDQINIEIFNQSAEEYLQEHRVFELFSDLC